MKCYVPRTERCEGTAVSEMENIEKLTKQKTEWILGAMRKVL